MTKGRKNKGGRPAHKPTEESKERVVNYLLVDTPHKQIARLMGIDYKTLRKHYESELEDGVKDMHRRLAGHAYKMAFEGDVAMTIFLLKTRLRWSEKLLEQEIANQRELPRIEAIIIPKAEQDSSDK